VIDIFYSVRNEKEETEKLHQIRQPIFKSSSVAPYREFRLFLIHNIYLIKIQFHIIAYVHSAYLNKYLKLLSLLE
jgi:hypothetical protein